MYSCHLQFCLTGKQNSVFDIIKNMAPLEHFTHEFSESEKPRKPLAAKADVIIANLQDTDVIKTLKKIISDKNEKAELILLTDKEQIALINDLSEIKDIWIMPMSEEEIKFRFLRWQQTCKLDKDRWQADHFLESTINNNPNMIWFKDKDGVHEKVNESFCKTVGKTKKQVEGRRHAYIWDVEQDDPVCIESENKVMKDRKTYVAEETVQSGDGTKLLTTYKSPLYDLDGSVMGTVGVAIDITKERAYEQEIITKNQTLETIFTTMDCGVMYHSMNGDRILSINRAALKILGYESQDELIAEGFDMVAASVVEEDKDKLRKVIRTLEKEGDCVSVEYRVQHKDGEIIHVMGNVKIVKEHGELFYQRFLLDCTAQKLEEKKNKNRQRKLIQALSIDYNLVCFFDMDNGTGTTLRLEDDGNVIFHSIFTENISLRDSMEQYIQECVYEDDREMMRQFSSLEILRDAITEKKGLYANYRTVIDGKIKYYQMKAVRVGAWQESHGIVLGFRDVDDEIHSQMEQQNILRDALSQANNANEAKSRFLSNMSHDIRTPMNAIVGFTNLAINHINNKEQVQEYLKKIMTSGNHLLSLINDVLDMSRIESGKMQLDEQPYNLTDILYGLRSIVQADVHAKHLKLKIDSVNVVNEDIYCDKLRLNQVLLNLVGNSIKYTNAGGTVSVKVTEKPGAPAGYSNYEFYVKDTGIGMSEEFLAHIFEPFEREINTKNNGIQGTGLGMAITKNIVDMMKGSIEVRSKMDVGTEFIVFFTFRLHSPSSVADIPKSEKDMKTAGNVQKGKSFIFDTDEKDSDDIEKKAAEFQKGRILLAEDIELNQEIATAVLEEAGFTIEIADNGQIAVNMLKQSEPGYYQLILMDVQMPVLNGYEATKEIRQLENKELASIPIIAMTANAFEEDRREALKCGMNGHIAKPFDVENLINTLEHILK